MGVGQISGDLDFVFLHGGGQGSWCWDDTLAAMSLQARCECGSVLALDVPGCGRKRGRSTEDLSMEAVAEELIADISTAGLDDVILVGHSQGGQAMSLMAATEPALFRRLIYVSCSFPKPGQTVLQMIGNCVSGTNPDEVGWPVEPATTTMEHLYELNVLQRHDGKPG